MFFFLIIVLLNGLPSLHLADEVHHKNLKVMSTYRPPLEHFVNTNRLQYKTLLFCRSNYRYWTQATDIPVAGWNAGDNGNSSALNIKG